MERKTKMDGLNILITKLVSLNLSKWKFLSY